jgi:outer membrane protein OmpA-like peptidoglycan-associated protein
MNIKTNLLLLLLLACIGFGWWFWTNQQRSCCNNSPGSVVTKNNLPYYFTASGDTLVETGAGFNAYADSLNLAYQNGNSIKVIGNWYTGEDSTAGLARARALANLLVPKYLSNTAAVSYGHQLVSSAAPTPAFAGANVFFNAPLPTLKANSDTTTSALLNGKLIIYFPSGGNKNIFDKATQKNINDIVVLQKQNGKTIVVTGYTDSQGKPDKNIVLSKERAERLKQILVQNGVPADKIKTEGKGQENPVATNETANGRALNRRAEVSFE